MSDSGTIVYCAGPYWTPEETQSLSALARILEHAGYGTYLPHSDGIEDLVWKLAATVPLSGKDAVLGKIPVGDAQAVRVVDMSGTKAYEVTPENGFVTVRLIGAPVYLRL